jgi:hypothetical protein
MLPSEAGDRLERLLEIFGHHLVWSRNVVLSRIKDRLSSPEKRRTLSDEARAVYDNLASSDANEQLLLEFVKEGTDLLLCYLLGLFANIGSDLQLDDRHAIWYKVILEISDIDSRDVVEEQVLNRDQKQFLPDYLASWLAKYGEYMTNKNGTDPSP